MRLTATQAQANAASDVGVHQTFISLQHAEIIRLRQECDVARASLDSLRSELKERDDIRSVTQQLREIIDTGRRAGDEKELREKLSIAEEANDQLRAQLQQGKQRLSELEGMNQTLRDGAATRESTRAALEDTLLKEKAHFAKESERFAGRIKNADDDVSFLETTLDEMEQRAVVAEREAKWTEDQLVLCSHYIKDLLGEISTEREGQRILEQNASSAFLCGSRLNRNILTKTQSELAQAKTQEISHLVEIRSLQDELVKQERVIEIMRTTDIHISEALEAGKSVNDGVPQEEEASLPQPTHLVSNDPRLYMTPGGVLEDMFRALSSKSPNPIAIEKILGIRNVAIVFPADFAWDSCPDTAYIVKPALCHGKGGKWKDAKLKSVKRLQRHGPAGAELIPHFSGAFYYVGTYRVGAAEPMTAQQFERLPEKTQSGVISSSGKPVEFASLRELYLSGKLSAIRFPVRRVGFNVELERYLRLNA